MNTQSLIAFQVQQVEAAIAKQLRGANQTISRRHPAFNPRILLDFYAAVSIATTTPKANAALTDNIIRLGHHVVAMLPAAKKKELLDTMKIIDKCGTPARSAPRPSAPIPLPRSRPNYSSLDAYLLGQMLGSLTAFGITGDPTALTYVDPLDDFI